MRRGRRPVQARVRIEKSELKDVLKEVNAAEEQVRGSDADPKLKQTVLDHLQAIRAAINAYEVGGVDYLEKVVMKSAGVIWVHRELFRSDTKTAGTYVGVIGRCQKLIALAKSTLNLLPAAADAKNAFERLIGNG